MLKLKLYMLEVGKRFNGIYKKWAEKAFEGKLLYFVPIIIKATT